MHDLTVEAACGWLADSRATALLILTGYPDPAVPLVRAVRRDPRLRGLRVGAPAGQPEFADWADHLQADGFSIPFLRYLPDPLDHHGDRVQRALRARLDADPSFVGFEGYDAVLVFYDLMNARGADRAALHAAWSEVTTRGTRGAIRFTREPELGLWQWRWAPTQVVERDPVCADRFRVLHPG